MLGYLARPKRRSKLDRTTRNWALFLAWALAFVIVLYVMVTAH